MGKLLLINIPAYGHVNPTLPIVTELVRRGHQVIYYDAETFERSILATGATFRSYPDSGATESEFTRRANNLASVTVFILGETIRLLPFLLAEIEREKPDLVIFDTIALWGMLAARLRHIPSAASIATFINDGVPGLLKWRDYLHIFSQGVSQLPALRRLRQQLVETYGGDVFPGKSILPCKGEINLVYTSRTFQPNTPYIDDSFHFVGPSILVNSRQDTEFHWHLLDSKRPKIYLSLGTLYNRNLSFYRGVLKDFSDHPAQFILSVGHFINIQDLETIPANFIVLPSVPQLELLQKVDLFITHGGMNSVNESFYYGVPIIVIPQQIEQALNGRQVAYQMAGILLGDTPPYGHLRPGVLRQAVDKVFAEPAYHQNAERLGRSFREAGGYQQAANVLLSRLK